jgi:hypothetical protein
MPSSLEIESFLNKHLQDQYPGEGRNSIKKLDFSSEDFSK